MEIQKECIVCGRYFIASRRDMVYCCEDCKTKAALLRDAQIKVCAQCGAEFYATGRNQKYCSDECNRKASIRKMKESYRPQQPREKVCGCCGAIFYGTGKRKYCSDACALHMRCAGKPQEPEQGHKSSIDDIVKAAQAEGLSYGQYVLKEKMRKCMLS